MRLLPEVLNVRRICDIIFFVLEFFSFLPNALLKLIDRIGNTVFGAQVRVTDMRKVGWRIGDGPQLLVEPTT